MRLSLAIALLAAACGEDPGTGVDVDAGGDVDAGELTSGLRIELAALPAVPGTWDNDFDGAIDEAELELGDLRIVGDANADRTRVDELTLKWESQAPAIVSFADAPIGRYSRIRATIEGLDMEGTFTLDGETEEWQIKDMPPGGVDIDLSIEIDLEPGDVVTIGLEVDLRPIFDAVDWEQVSEDSDGVYVLGEDSPMIDAVREKLEDSFKSRGN